jgi:hypothetical protein
MRSALFILALSINIGLFANHPLHFSVVNINLDKDSRTLSYSVRLFQEDLIVLIGMLNHEALHKNQELDSNAVHAYISGAFQIFSNEKQVVCDLMKKESSELEYWLYYETILPNIPEMITIQNRIFLELFQDQQNLVIFSFKNKEKGLTFSAQIQKQPIALDSI